MKSKNFVVILLIVSILIGYKFWSDNDKKPVFNNKPAKVVEKFLSLIDKKDTKKAFDLWDFSFLINPRSFDKRLSKQQEKMRWLSIKQDWEKEKSKPYIEGVDQKGSEASVGVTWDMKLYLWEKESIPKQNLVIVVLRFIKGHWKIVGLGMKM